MTQRKIWGFEVATSPKGKNIWSYDLKREVVRPILDDDQHIGTIAAEIGAHECHVRKWCVAARRESAAGCIRAERCVSQPIPWLSTDIFGSIIDANCLRLTTPFNDLVEAVLKALGRKGKVRLDA